MRLIIYLILFYLIYRIVKFVITSSTKKSHTQKEYYTYNEYGFPRKEKDITNEVKILEEKRLNKKD